MALRYLVTGSTGGLGLAVVDELRRIDLDGAEVEVESLNRADADFSSPQAVSNAILARSGALGRGFDAIVHCAGAAAIQPLRMHRDHTFADMMVAASCAYGILRAAACDAVSEGGSIVLMSSVAAHRGTAGMAAYSAGKAAVEAMARCAAIELAPRGIRVNCVAAGAFESPMHQRITKRMPAASRDAYEARHPLGFGDARNVARTVVHLVSEGSSWTTGSTVVVDGGFLAR